MKITNKHNLPQQLVNAVTYDDYGDPKSWTPTSLIRPAWMAKLMREHWDEIEEDVSDRLWALIGSAAHVVLERAANGAVTEKRYYAELDGEKISAKIDLLDGDLVDYKITSVWSIKDCLDHGPKPEWEQQMNIQAWLLRKNGMSYRNIEIVGIARDWQESKRFDSNYPPRAAALPVPEWDDEEVEKFILDRIEAHKNPKICTPEERWEKKPVFALMKKGRKRAVKLFDSREEAEANMGPDMYVDFRPGESVRCERYCSVSEFCTRGIK